MWFWLSGCGPPGVANLDARVCGDCHSVDQGQFVAPGGATDPDDPAVGAHPIHLHGGDKSVGMTCAECHPSPEDIPSHIDGEAQISWGEVADTRGVAEPYDGSGSCTVWCHGADFDGRAIEAPEWTRVDGSQVECGSCHTLPPPEPHPVEDRCFVCHDATAGPGPEVVTPALHIDGRLDFHPGESELP